MIDKYGRSITHEEIGGKHHYIVSGKFTIVSDSEDGALAKIEAILPDVSEYESQECDFSKYQDIFDKDFEGSTYGGQLKAKFKGDLVSASDAMRNLIFRMYERRMEEVFLLYPNYEPLGWPIKRIQAAMWLALDDSGKDAAMATYASPLCQYRILFAEANPVSSLAKANIDDLANKIFANGYVFEQYYGEITGYKTELLRQLSEAESVSGILAIDIDFNAIKSLAEHIP